MSDQKWQDWTPVSIINPTAPKIKTRTGLVIKKQNSGNNQHHNSVCTPYKVEKIVDDEDKSMVVPKINLSMAQKIQQGRVAKNWTQKELAIKVNERANIINDYESGNAIPTPSIISKLERALNVKLRG